MDALSGVQLGIEDIAEVICKHKMLKVSRSDLSIGPGKIEIQVRPDDSASSKRSTKARATAAEEDNADLSVRSNYLRRMIPTVAISSYLDAARAIIQKDKDTHMVLVERYGLLACMNTSDVDGRRTKTNNVTECQDVLGIEAARTTIAYEIGEVMKDMSIDQRHMQVVRRLALEKGDFGPNGQRKTVFEDSWAAAMASKGE